METNILLEDIRKGFHDYSCYKKTRSKSKKLPSKNLLIYDDHEKYGTIQDQYEYKKGEKHNVDAPLKMSKHAKDRRNERPCKPGELMYDVEKGSTIVTSYPISKNINTNLLKHMDNSVCKLRKRTTF